MYLSHLMIDVGDNPDRPRPGRLWLRNMYHVHQRLCMAFPSSVRKEDDPRFLAPYKPDDFPQQRHLAGQKDTEIDSATLAQVHTQRSEGAGFLFRVDPLPGGRAMIVVLSQQKPDWAYAFGLNPEHDPRTKRPIGNAGYLLAAIPEEPRPLHVSINSGARFRFRLTANPTRKTGTLMKSERLAMEECGMKYPKRHGRRDPVPQEALEQWLRIRSEGCGFRLIKITAIQTGYVYFNKTHDAGNGQRLRSARYEGILEVTDPGAFRETLASGIGSAKAYGFGLLSVAPVSGG